MTIGFLKLNSTERWRRSAALVPGTLAGPQAFIALKCLSAEVTVVDISVSRINAWNSDQLPIYEPGLDDVVKQCRGQNLFSSTNVEKHVVEADIEFVSTIVDDSKSDKIVVTAECNGLPEAAEYWRQVIKINDYQKSRFVNRLVYSMFNTVANKKIAILGFAFRKDTGDTRETPAIDVCKGLLGDKARPSIYDPQLTEDQIQRDLTMIKFDWDYPVHLQPLSPTTVKQVSVVWDACSAVKDAHALCILTEPFQKIYDNIQKPSFVFNGRNVINVEKLRKIGFITYSIGKPLDAWLKDMPAVA